MSRLAAVENMLYYPTPPEEIQLYLNAAFGDQGLTYALPWRDKGIYVLDPCGGEGQALQTVMGKIDPGRDAKIIPYLVELDARRAELAHDRFSLEGSVTQADFDTCNVKGAFEFIFLNPPYDDDKTQKRTEIKWLRRVAPYLRSRSGFMLYVVPEKIVNKRLQIIMSELDLQLAYHTMRFSEKNYGAFSQVCMLFTRNSYQREDWSFEPLAGYMQEDMGLPWTRHRYHNINSGKRPHIEIMDYEHENSLLEEETLPSELVGILGPPNQRFETKVIMPLRNELSAALVAAGLFTGMRIGNQIVRGQIIQEIEKVSYVDAVGNQVQEEIPRQIALLNQLDMTTGKIERISSKEDPDKFNDVLLANAPAFNDTVQNLYPPLLTDEFIEKWRPELSKVRSPRYLPGHKDGLLEPQLVRAAAILRGWELIKCETVAGEMGVGKTVTSLAAAVQVAVRRGNPRKRKVVILLPAKKDLVDKWEEEIKTSLREYKPRVFEAASISDLQKAFTYEGLAFILIRETMLKRSSGWENLPPVKGDLFKRKCPTCGKTTIMRQFKSDREVEKEDKQKGYCASCGGSLWYEKRDHNDNAYSPLARYIRQHYNGGYVLIVDEAHGYKGADTNRAYASNDVIVGAYKVLMMTGTLYNGMASSIFYLLYRTLPAFRQIYNHNDATLFVQKYGLEKKTIKFSVNGSSTYSGSGYKKPSVSTHEIPGIHPLMLLWLIGFTIYFKLDDLDLELPPKEEHTLFVEPDQDYRKPVESYLNSMYAEARRNATAKPPDMSLMGNWVWARTGAWDVAPMGDIVDIFKLDPLAPEEIHPKEEALLRILIKHHEKNERVLIYYDQTNVRPVHDRLIALGAEHNLKIVFMPSTTTNRVRFIRDAILNGADAIITNPQLVKEGIDLVMFKAISWYGTTFDANLAQQANRRIYRIGQDKETHIYYLGYNATAQSDALSVLAKKIEAAQTAHGDLRHGLAAILCEDNLVNMVQQGVFHSEMQDSDILLDDLPELYVVEKKEKTFFKRQIDTAKELGEKVVQLQLF
jgi:predicted RNA-binding Zn-ribbon protein involved in translation (DUF1610 family)